MLVLLDRQHYGKPSPRQKDRGVAVDLDGDGNIDAMEANLTPSYIQAAREALEAAGHTVVLLDAGWYPDRHKAAIRQVRAAATGLPAAYVACHLNAGGGNYGLVLHDARSTGGEALANRVGDAMRRVFEEGELKRVLVKGASASEWTNAYNTIRGIYAGPGNLSGICFEPVFVDTHRGLLDPEGLARIGAALASGLEAWGVAEDGQEGVAPQQETFFDDGIQIQDRDPRLDPRAGDVVISRKGKGREVLDRTDRRVIWRKWPFGGRARNCKLQTWLRKMEEGAVVDGTVLRL